MSVKEDSPIRNSKLGSPTFGAIANVNSTGVQKKGLNVGEFTVEFSNENIYFYFAVKLIFRGELTAKITPILKLKYPLRYFVILFILNDCNTSSFVDLQTY